MPGEVGHVRIGALLEQHRRQVEMRVDDREDERGGADARDRRSSAPPPSAGRRSRGSATAFRSAPSSASARAAVDRALARREHQRRPAAARERRVRAAAARELQHRRLEHGRARVDVGARPRPAPARPRRGSRAAAHISAVSPNHRSRALTSAPRPISACTASALPVRAAVMSTGSPAGVACSDRRRPRAARSSTWRCR